MGKYLSFLRRASRLSRLDSPAWSLNNKWLGPFHNTGQPGLGPIKSKNYGTHVNQEEALRFQRSREEWIKYGDGNTKFYHAFIAITSQRNIIEGLKK